jgi:hypothetical protein
MPTGLLEAAPACGVEVGALSAFVQALHHSGISSVDAFLSRRADLVAAGKLSIAFAIATQEDRSNLHQVRNNDDWYMHLWNRMTADANDIGQVASKMWKGNEIYITENGCGAADDPGADSIVYDSDRIMFLRSFTQLQRATSEGIPAKPDGRVRVVGRLPATGLA